MVRESIREAVGSSMICSLLGSQWIFRPRIIAMLPRWATVADRWPISTGVTGSFRDLTQSRKSRRWPWRWSPVGLARWISLTPIFSRARPAGSVFRLSLVTVIQRPDVDLGRTELAHLGQDLGELQLAVHARSHHPAKLEAGGLCLQAGRHSHRRSQSGGRRETELTSVDRYLSHIGELHHRPATMARALF